tara:strand:+ start:135 stop:611 length:477 start_codon:yes stop_codon:yes gene_type:complete
MDLEKKLSLMRKYDFSSIGNNGQLPYGFGNSVSSIGVTVENRLAGNGDLREGIETLFRKYGYLRAAYDTIDFSELDADDPDFQLLFNVRALLPQLGASIFQFGKRISNEGYHSVANAQDEGNKVLEYVKGLSSLNWESYRNRIKEIEAQLPTEPTPSQ